MIKISIIIPVYNVEDYIHDCILSIVNQPKFNECELILIDDGSTDDSGIICDLYAKEYENILTFHKHNEGVSSARNYGLLNAKGKYICFFDSDDYISFGSLSDLINEIEEPFDILYYDGVLDNKNKLFGGEYFIHNELEENKTYSGKEFIIKSICKNKMFITVWLGIYNRKFLLENQLLFDDIMWHEDEIWTPRILLKASNIRYLKKNIYHYRIRENSIMRNKEYKKHIKCMLHVLNQLENIYNEIDDSFLKKILFNNLANKYLALIYKWNMIEYPRLLRKINIKKLKRWSFSIKTKIKLLLLWFSPKLYCFIMRTLGDKKWRFILQK